jgi:hypothetical protein
MVLSSEGQLLFEVNLYAELRLEGSLCTDRFFLLKVSVKDLVLRVPVLFSDLSVRSTRVLRSDLVALVVNVCRVLVSEYRALLIFNSWRFRGVGEFQMQM